jgi:hypothetical protein
MVAGSKPDQTMVESATGHYAPVVNTVLMP